MAHLLIVDDEGDIRHLYSEELKEDGHDVETACNSAEVMARLRKQRFDLVILDIKLDQESGLDLLKRIASLHGDLPMPTWSKAPTWTNSNRKSGGS